MRYKIPFTIGLCITLLLTSCSNLQPSPTPLPVEAAPTEELPYPAPVDPGSILPYPDPDSSSPAITVELAPTPTFDPTLGIVKGRILEGDHIPTSYITLYLAEVMKDSAGNDMLASFSRVDSPRTDTDSAGYFAFVNIHPGKYGLVLDTVVNSYLLHYPDKEEQVIIVVEQGKEVNIGELVYDSLPLPHR